MTYNQSLGFKKSYSKMDYENLKQKLEEAKSFFQPEIEKTIFSVGGRGYYENPISDILAFFFNPQEVHGLGMEWARNNFPVCRGYILV